MELFDDPQLRENRKKYGNKKEYSQLKKEEGRELEPGLQREPLEPRAIRGGVSGGGAKGFEVEKLKRGTAIISGTTETVTDTDCLPTSIIARTTDDTPAGFMEVIVTTGSFTVNSTTTETNLGFNYLLVN